MITEVCTCDVCGDEISREPAHLNITFDKSYTELSDVCKSCVKTVRDGLRKLLPKVQWQKKPINHLDPLDRKRPQTMGFISLSEFDGLPSKLKDV